MSNRKSPLYSVIAFLVSLVILAGGAAKLYRGVNNIAGSKPNPKIAELLEASDASVAAANVNLTEVSPAFQELLSDFDKMGVTAYRSERRDTGAKLIELFAGASKHLEAATDSINEAIKLGADTKVVGFLQTRTRSYELLTKVNTQNIDIIRVTLDDSIVDADAIVEKVTSIAVTRDADQQAANDATAEADAMLK